MGVSNFQQSKARDELSSCLCFEQPPKTKLLRCINVKTFCCCVQTLCAITKERKCWGNRENAVVLLMRLSSLFSLENALHTNADPFEGGMISSTHVGCVDRCRISRRQKRTRVESGRCPCSYRSQRDFRASCVRSLLSDKRPVLNETKLRPPRFLYSRCNGSCHLVVKLTDAVDQMFFSQLQFNPFREENGFRVLLSEWVMGSQISFTS